jgi:chromosome segregation ATPase
MFNFDGQLVATSLAIQDAGEFCRSFIRDRAAITAADLQHELIAVHQRYEQLAGRYNNLADRYNDVLEENKRFDAAHADAIAKKDGQIAQLVAEKERLAAEREESRRSAYEGWTKLTRALEEIERLKIKAGELAPDERKPDVDL